MNTSDFPPAPSAAPAAPPAAAARRRGFSWGFWITVAIVLSVGAGILLPVFNTTCVKGSQTKTLAQAKQIALALRLYAEDHEGRFPAGTNEYGETIRTANDAFRSLFPTYITAESIFANKLSAYQTAPPDGKISPPGEILCPGENVYGYVMGVIDDKPSAFVPFVPLVVDGTDGTGRGTYSSDPKARGGTWEGKKAIVIRADTSGTIENLLGPADARYIGTPLPDGTKGNLLSPAALGPSLKLLDPAISPAPRK